MPRYNKHTELTRVNGYMIPAESTHYAMGAMHGLFFKCRGQWNFTALTDFYIPVTGEDPQAIVENSIGENKIEVLK